MDALLITSPSGAPLPLTVGEFAAAFGAEWGERSWQAEATEEAAATFSVEPVGETAYSVSLARDGKSIWTNGLPEQNIRTAVWLRSLLREPAPRIIAFNSSWTWHVDLVPGITEAQFRASVVDHSVPGWDDDDPELG